jgi:hypothetical protein
MRVFLTIVCLSLTILGCNHSKNLTSANKLKQGIRGTVKEVTGNRMPGPGRELPEPKAVMTTVYVYEVTNLSQVVQEGTSPLYRSIKSRLIDSVMTDEKGNFAFSLEAGTYSLFAKVDGKYFANSFDGKNNIAPVTVEEGKVAETSILINDKATY